MSDKPSQWALSRARGVVHDFSAAPGYDRTWWIAMALDEVRARQDAATKRAEAAEARVATLGGLLREARPEVEIAWAGVEYNQDACADAQRLSNRIDAALKVGSDSEGVVVEDARAADVPADAGSAPSTSHPDEPR